MYQMASRKTQSEDTIVDVAGINVGRDFVIIAGPCAVESFDQLMLTARNINSFRSSVLVGRGI